MMLINLIENETIEEVSFFSICLLAFIVDLFFKGEYGSVFIAVFF